MGDFSEISDLNPIPLNNGGQAVLDYKIHWHVVLTHFPIALFLAAALFQVLHVFYMPVCFERATNVMLVAGTIMFTLSGRLVRDGIPRRSGVYIIEVVSDRTVKYKRLLIIR
jgi:hypothetical protein